MSARVSRMLTGGAIVAALALTGCSDGDAGADSGRSTPEPSSPRSSETTSENAASDSNPSENGATESGIDVKNPPKAIASMTVPGQANREVTDTLVELVRFEESGKVLLAVFRVTPHGTKENTDLWSAIEWRPQLVDLTNLKAYKSINALTTPFAKRLAMNEPYYAMAGFAIPANTDTIDIGVSEAGLRMQGVTLP